MATKTISVDIEAYRLLNLARTSPRESFSKVIKRAVWSRRAKTCGDLLKALADKPAAPEDVISRLDEAQTNDHPPDNHWS
jgi:predicted CopG family antitoxin